LYITDEMLTFRAPSANEVGRRMRSPPPESAGEAEESAAGAPITGGGGVAVDGTIAADATVERPRPKVRRPAAVCTVI